MFCQGIKRRQGTEDVPAPKPRYDNAIPNIGRTEKINTHFNDPEDTAILTITPDIIADA